MEPNSLLSAADNHNIANGDSSWFEQKADSVTDLGKDIGQALTYGAVGAVVAGATSIANSAIAIANFVGADVGEISTYKVLKSLDDDLGKYYEGHQEGVEIAGFALGALVPGTAGVKALRAAKAGYLGTNSARSMGLVESLTADYATAAKIELSSPNNPFTIYNANLVKAIGQGFGAQALEAAAFEVAVAGTMFKSPVLDEQGAGSLASNILVGTVIGGGIGGVLHGVGLVYGVKKAGSMVDRELFPFRNINELDENASPDLKLINYFHQKLNFPEAKLPEDAGPIRPGTTPSFLDNASRLELIQKERDKTLDRLDVLIRQEFNRYSGGDEAIGIQLFNKTKEINDINQIAAALINSKGASRITTNESLTLGDTLFLKHGMKDKDFQDIINAADHHELLTDVATANTQGYRVVGDMSALKVAGFKMRTDDHGIIYNRDAAFAAGYDVFRNSNGKFSVNPASEILQATDARRLPNNLIVDFENGGVIVDKAIPGLADLASKTKPVKVVGDTVLAGDLNPIKITKDFDMVNDPYLNIQARYIHMFEQNNIKWENKIIHEHDIPMLERAAWDEAEGFRIQLKDGKTIKGESGDFLDNFIIDRKNELATEMSKKGMSLNEMSLRLNISEKWLQGELGEDIHLSKMTPGDDYNVPRYAKIDYSPDIRAMDAYNASYVDGMVQYEQSVAMVKQRHIQTVENYLANSGITLPEAINWSDPGRTPTRDGAGASLFGFANSNYGTAGGWAQFVGTVTNRIKVLKKTETIQALNDVAAGVNTPALRSELDLVTNKLRSSPDAWVQHPTQADTLIKRSDYKNVLKGGDPEEVIEMSPQVMTFMRAHAEINAARQVHVKNLKSNAGLMDDSDLAVFYPPPINTANYKHFVFVEPKGINLGDKKRMIVAKDEQTLLKLIAQVPEDSFKIITKTDSEEWKKALGEYEFSLGINESLVDSSLKRKGVLSEHFAGNPSQRILDDYLDWHTKQEEMLATRMVEHRYSQSFQELQHLGDRYTNIATSQFRSLTDALIENVKDPYNDIVKTALDISRASEYKWWRSFNDTVKDAIETPGRALGRLFAETPAIDDAFVANVNTMADKLGLGMPYKDAYAAMAAAGNIADKPFLSKFISKAQALMSTTLLQLDFFNAVNNIVSTPILLSAEMKYLMGAIQRGDANIAGKLSEIVSVGIPSPQGVSQITLPTTQKLLRNAFENYRKDANEQLGLLERYQRIGAVTDVLQQERQMLGELTVDFGKLSSGSAESIIAKATESGRRLTGNRYAEEMTRFVSADVMRQVTDLALEAGVLRNAAEADEYIQLFVNKVQGNYLHSQRPIVFQGVVGQAVSLFQTYQFNLMQQLFKYVGDGDKKSLAMLLGLQGSIYGMQGLPAFNFLNTHIVGNSAGNTEHRDLYYAANTVFGKSLGDWLLYGAGSNALGLIDSHMKLNLYSRGDINPRQVTVLPTTFSDIPVVNASISFVGNLYKAASKVANGADLWPTLSQAIEHNGLSRPLAGLGQIVQGYTTTSQGSLLSSAQDFWSIATVSRVAGAKPFDEAIALDALYRVNAYRAADLSRIQEIGSALKTTLIKGHEPSEQEITDFATRYAKAGGRIENFSRFMATTAVNANKSQVNKLAENLRSPFSQQMQIVMGGHPLNDFTNQAPQ